MIFKIFKRNVFFYIEKNNENNKSVHTNITRTRIITKNINIMRDRSYDSSDCCNRRSLRIPPNSLIP